MREINDIIKAYDNIKHSSNKIAMATVIGVKGSSYRRPGARMLVQDNGEWTGGISGGCLEGDALKKANFAISGGKTEVVTYDTTKDDEHQIGVGLGCNGIIDVLMQPIDKEDERNPVELLRSCQGVRTANVLLTLIRLSDQSLTTAAGTMIKYRSPDSLPVDLQGPSFKALIQDIDAAEKSLQSATKSYQDYSIFIEVLPPPLRLVLFGSNYDVFPLLRMIRELGWAVDVVTNPNRANNVIFELADTIIPKRTPVAVDEFTAFVLMSHDYKTDKENLRMALGTDVHYIGMLGPAVRGEKTIRELKEEGLKITADDFARIFNPIGLDTGADTPEDIAISILAEIKAHFSNREGGFLRNREGTIYDR
jgi:xanthine/CO dehydrogenase XdhC/CoxF family maturation factor